MTARITVFTKPDCPYCAEAKSAMEKDELSWDEIDVTASERNGHASVWLSGAATVPQVFFGDLHINGSIDVEALHRAKRLAPLAQCSSGELGLDAISDADLARGAEDIKLRDVIPESDGSRDEDPETWPILRLYKEFFGFWPNCFYFMHHWPEAYKLFVYCHNAGGIQLGREKLGAPVMMAAGFATSNAHGCNYCMVHSKATGGDMSLGMGELVEAARRGNAPPDSPIGPFELALTDLAADAAMNTVSDSKFYGISDLHDQARLTKEDAATNVMGTAMIASAFGFLNVFNDLTGVKVEAEWAEKASAQAGVDAGRHGVSEDRKSDNLDYDLPEGGPSMQEMMEKYEAIVSKAGCVRTYCEAELGMMPAWIGIWPEALQARHAHFYAEIMQDRDHSPIPGGLKHLMARVSAIACGHDYLAAVEGWLAWNAEGRDDQAISRMKSAFDAAKDRELPADLFSNAETAALRLAWISAQTPLTTPRRFVEPAIEAWSPVELLHLLTVCGMASMVQRYVAIVQPEIEPEVRDFHIANGSETDTLALRYRPQGHAQAADHA